MFMKRSYYFSALMTLVHVFVIANDIPQVADAKEIPALKENVIPSESVEALVNEYINNKEYSNKTKLCKIMCDYGSDKGNGTHHNYTTLYEKLFNKYQNQEINIFELGLGTNNTDVKSNMGHSGKPGASHYGWAEYFPKAKVYGADIDKRVLFNTERIQTFYCDQLDEKCIRDMFSNEVLKNIKFDIIIEDGLHEFEGNRIFLINSIDKLKDGGIYISEDLLWETIQEFKKIIPDLKKQFSLKYINIIFIPGANHVDNALLIIQK